MVYVFQRNYQISASNNNVAGLASLEGAAVSGDNPIPPFRGFGGYDNGSAKVRENGTLYLAGYPSCVWYFDYLSFLQYGYISTTYCGGSISGLVTIKTTLAGSTIFANYNAVLTIKKRSELSWRVGGVFDNVQLVFTRLVAL